VPDHLGPVVTPRRHVQREAWAPREVRARLELGSGPALGEDEVRPLFEGDCGATLAKPVTGLHAMHPDLCARPRVEVEAHPRLSDCLSDVSAERPLFFLRFVADLARLKAAFFSRPGPSGLPH
jgi:hypothetical protein